MWEHLRGTATYDRAHVEECVREGEIAQYRDEQILFRIARDQANRRDMKSLLAPIRALPLDVLFHILLLTCVSWDDQVTEQVAIELAPSRSSRDEYPPPPYDDFGSQWVLSQVCSRWRQSVLSSPLFWTTLYLDPGFHLWKDYETGATKVNFLTQLHLHRSGDVLPLDIILRGRVTDPDLISLLAPTSLRWRRLMCTEDTLWAFSKFPSLTTFFLLSTPLLPITRPRILFEAPALRVIYLLGSDRRTSFPLPAFKPEQITHLTCRDSTLRYDELRRMIGLREIWVALLLDPYLDDEPLRFPETLRFPSLEKFTVEEHQPTRRMHLITTHMNLPHLRDLRVNVSLDRSYPILLPTVSHPAQLRSLTVNLGPFHHDDDGPGLSRCLKAMDELEDLHITVGRETSVLILRLLSIKEASLILLPRMASLAIKFSSGDAYCHENAIFDLIASRVHFGTLRRLDISKALHEHLKHRLGSPYDDILSGLLSLSLV